MPTTKPILTFARHVVGLSAASIIPARLLHGEVTPASWALVALGVMFWAGIMFGLYALFFTDRAKRVWPNGLFVLAWVLMGLLALSGWQAKPQPQPPALQFDPSTARPIDE